MVFIVKRINLHVWNVESDLRSIYREPFLRDHGVTDSQLTEAFLKLNETLNPPKKEISKIFAPKRTKFDLIRDLIKDRLREDPTAAAMGATPEMVDQQPDEVLIGTPEATIVTIIEAYHALQNSGASLAETFIAIERHRNQLIPGEMPISALSKSGTGMRCLHIYINYRVQLEHRDGPELSVKNIIHALFEATKFYKPDAREVEKLESIPEPRRTDNRRYYVYLQNEVQGPLLTRAACGVAQYGNY
jgi:hypothetical protein